ncbi:MAG TPA: serine/threonine-protein kinase, partial [Gemmataceae bacterium]
VQIHDIGEHDGRLYLSLELMEGGSLAQRLRGRPLPAREAAGLAEAVAALTHPNIVQVYESGERDGLPYFALEYCDGGSLQQKLGGQPLPPRLAADIAEQLAQAMAYAHGHGIVHRDLKPANILFAGEESSPSKDTKPPSKDGKTSRDGGPSKAGQSVTASKASHVSASSSGRGQRVTPKITDFGLAKRLEDDSGLTGSGTILGTPSYMAPEQAAGRTKDVGPPADIHALGAILYEMLTGRPPFLGSDVVDTMNQVRTMDPVPPTRIQPKTPRDLETVCLKCLEKEMHRRYATAGEMADDLRRFLHGEPIAARPVPVWEKGWKWAKRRPAQAALIGVVAAVLLVAAVGGFAFGRYKDQQAKLEEMLRKDADDKRRLAEQASERAEANFKDAREAADELLVRIGAERLQHVPQAEKLRRELLEKSLGFYDRFLTVHSDNPTVRREAGWAFQRVGRIRNDLGERKDAIAAYRKAADLFAPLSRETTDHQADDTFDLAETYRQLTVVLEDDGRPADADAAYESARAALRQLADAHADRPGYRLRLGDLLVDRAAQFYRRRRLAESEDAFRQALAEFDRLCRDAPTSEHRFSRAKAQANLGAVILVAGRSGPALDELRKAVDWLTDLVRDFPGRPEYVKELGQAAYNLGNALYQNGQLAEAERAYRDAVR